VVKTSCDFFDRNELADSRNAGPDGTTSYMVRLS